MPAGIQGERVYNRALLILKNGVYGGSYDKEHLVPFGEYVPTILQWDLLSGLLQDVGAYTAGNGSGPLRTDNLAIGTLICYEGIFPWLAQARTAEGANVLVDISNDGWFGDTPAPRQHMYLTALRALEQNRWLVRGTNTGISCVVDPWDASSSGAPSSRPMPSGPGPRPSRSPASITDYPPLSRRSASF